MLGYAPSRRSRDEGSFEVSRVDRAPLLGRAPWRARPGAGRRTFPAAARGEYDGFRVVKGVALGVLLGLPAWALIVLALRAVLG